MVITIAILLETRNHQTQCFSETESQGYSSTRSSKLPSPCLCGWDGHRRSPCNRPTGPARPARTDSRSRALNLSAGSTKDNQITSRQETQAGARRRWGPGSLWGPRNSEVTSFSGQTAQGCFAAALLRAFDFCTCTYIHPPLPGRRF